MKQLKGAPDAIDKRSITATKFINFPSDIQPNNYRVSGYLQGKELCWTAIITFDLFDVVSYLHSSECQRSGREIIHCIGYRGREKKTTVLTIEKK